MANNPGALHDVYQADTWHAYPSYTPMAYIDIEHITIQVIRPTPPHSRVQAYRDIG